MKWHSNKNLWKKMMIGGSLLIAFSIFSGIFSLFSVYGKAGKSLNSNNGASFETEQLIANIAMLSRLVGIIVLLIGLMLYFINRSNEK